MALKTFAFDAADYLDSPEAISAYLNDAIANGDAEELVAALGTVARAKGMSVVAQDTGFGRESLYKALSGSANPAFSTISRVLTSFGLKISITPARRSSRRYARAKTSAAS